ncbi:hypothetical protein [Amycolatopsis sp. NBRC 101858]|uniref:hypothetical protein n=1 Tax=Amycolatopsis sp. NBRC 101858 TaxID=3032200 RepID=UPI0025562019|nr:hypothetical protein [Amycolatopsis sp. NBRC 101858]
MPEPILVAIAAALAAKSATSLYDLVRRKFAKDPASTAALEAAMTAPDDPQPVKALAERLHRAESDDKAFADALRTEWHRLPDTERTHGGVHNQVTGTSPAKWCKRATSTATSTSETLDRTAKYRRAPASSNMLRTRGRYRSPARLALPT